MKRVQAEPRFKDGWGDTIREIREYRGYSKYELAKIIGVSIPTISKWEREIMVPSAYMAIKISDALLVDPETIFDI